MAAKTGNRFISSVPHQGGNSDSKFGICDTGRKRDNNQQTETEVYGLQNRKYLYLLNYGWYTIEIPTANLEFWARGAYKSASNDNDTQPETDV